MVFSARGEHFLLSIINNCEERDKRINKKNKPNYQLQPISTIDKLCPCVSCQMILNNRVQARNHEQWA